MVWGLVFVAYGVWFQVDDLWSLGFEHGVWFLVRGASHLVCVGPRFLIFF